MLMSKKEMSKRCCILLKMLPSLHICLVMYIANSFWVWNKTTWHCPEILLFSLSDFFPSLTWNDWNIFMMMIIITIWITHTKMLFQSLNGEWIISSLNWKQLHWYIAILLPLFLESSHFNYLRISRSHTSFHILTALNILKQYKCCKMFLPYLMWLLHPVILCWLWKFK